MKRRKPAWRFAGPIIPQGRARSLDGEVGDALEPVVVGSTHDTSHARPVDLEMRPDWLLWCSMCGISWQGCTRDGVHVTRKGAWGGLRFCASCVKRMWTALGKEAGYG